MWDTDTKNILQLRNVLIFLMVYFVIVTQKCQLPSVNLTLVSAGSVYASLICYLI